MKEITLNGRLFTIVHLHHISSGSGVFEERTAIINLDRNCLSEEIPLDMMWRTGPGFTQNRYGVLRVVSKVSSASLRLYWATLPEGESPVDPDMGYMADLGSARFGIRTFTLDDSGRLQEASSAELMLIRDGAWNVVSSSTNLERDQFVELIGEVKAVLPGAISLHAETLLRLRVELEKAGSSCSQLSFEERSVLLGLLACIQ